MRTPDAQEAIPLTTIQRALLVLLVLVLVLRGTFLVTLWYPQLLMTGLPASNFMRVIFLRDAAYVLTAMLGGLFLYLYPRMGWWTTMLHWSWYLAWQVGLVVIAELLVWEYPVRASGALYFTIPGTIAISTAALAVLLRPSIMDYCKIRRRNRLASSIGLFVACMLIALSLNWFSSV